jgi:hypothetical protein
MRTIICSDAHGYPSLVTNALVATGYAEGRDRFIYAGDLVDRGPDPAGCFELVDRLADTVLVGNHDVACALGLPVSPRDPRAFALAERLRRRMLATDGRWRLAATVDDVLVVHGGVGEHWRDTFDACERSIEKLASVLNGRLRAEIEGAVDGGTEGWGDGVLGYDGPLWFRPIEDGPPLVGVRQVVGHTPIEFYDAADEAILAALGVRSVDPGAYRFDATIGPGIHFRCAVIEGGRVEVLESSGLRDAGPRPESLLCY